MSKKLVVNGAELQCSQGAAPCKLVVLPGIATSVDQPVATVDDFIPLVNISGFGMCQSPSNPQVAAATSAAMGVLTPQPCIPVVTAAWSPGSSITAYNGKAALTDDSTCNCQWAGSVKINDSGTPMTTE